jgi:hypothetical protein
VKYYNPAAIIEEKAHFVFENNDTSPEMFTGINL